MRTRKNASTFPMAWSRKASFSTPLLVGGATLLASIVAGCARTPPRGARAQEILLRAGPLAENSFYACLLNGLAQHLPFKQIQDDCETKLEYDDKKGFGNGPAVQPAALGRPGSMDPGKLSATCNGGNPRVAGGKGPDGTGDIQHQNPYTGKYQDWGKYTWGGKGQCGADFCYKGLGEEVSEKRKHDAIHGAEKANNNFQEALEDSKENPDDKGKKAKADSLRKEAIEKAAKATEDPNKEPKATGGAVSAASPVGDFPEGQSGAARPTDGASPCAQALQEARENVAECQRTNWRAPGCQQLWAKMHHCPDPELIYVDPDAGYTCGTAIDPAALKDAVVEKCRELKRPVPGGPDPCEPPSVDRLGRFINSAIVDPCNDPAVSRNPDDPECYGTLVIQSFAPDLQTLLLWGLNKLGGPIVVLPDKDLNPSPKPGPDPRPGPK